MNTSEGGTVRELNAIEIEQVSGGKPHPGDGVGWVLADLAWNCAKKLVTSVGPLLW